MNPRNPRKPESRQEWDGLDGEELETGIDGVEDEFGGDDEGVGELLLHVGVELAGERIDKFVGASTEESVSRNQIQGWIKDGLIEVDGAVVKANYKVQSGQHVVVRVPPPVEVEVEPESMELEVVYEDSDVIVVNKPRGLVVHPAAGHHTGTLVNGLLAHCQDLSGINGKLRPGIVHRIDKDTSGLIMAAKHDQAHQSLARQLKAHEVTRKYVAVVHGIMHHEAGTVDAPIGRHPVDRRLYAVTDKNSKHAVTHFTVLERLNQSTMLELKLETGRTHQIRVHMKYIGHPLIGDPLYGKSRDRQMEGQALHAAVLGFVHPVSGEYLEFTAPLPADMEELLARLRME